MGVNITNSDIQTFQNSVGNHFVSTLKSNIKLFLFTRLVSAFSIFNPKKTPSVDTSEYQQCGEGSVE